MCSEAVYSVHLYTVHLYTGLVSSGPGRQVTEENPDLGLAEYSWNLELDYNNDRKLSSESPDIISEGGD